MSTRAQLVTLRPLLNHSFIFGSTLKMYHIFTKGRDFSTRITPLVTSNECKLTPRRLVLRQLPQIKQQQHKRACPELRSKVTSLPTQDTSGKQQLEGKGEIVPKFFKFSNWQCLCKTLCHLILGNNKPYFERLVCHSHQ
jgi:hypothetical protein